MFSFLLTLTCFSNSIVDLESVLIEIRGISLGMIKNAYIKSFNHSASEQIVFRAISSISIVLLAITVCLQDF